MRDYQYILSNIWLLLLIVMTILFVITYFHGEDLSHKMNEREKQRNESIMYLLIHTDGFMEYKTSISKIDGVLYNSKIITDSHFSLLWKSGDSVTVLLDSFDISYNAPPWE